MSHNTSLFLLLFCLSQIAFGQKVHLKETFNTEILNHNDLESVPALTKVEFGVQLPKEIAKKVDAFVTNSEGDKINPYLDWELRVFVVLTNENSNDTIEVDGFYYQEFLPHMVSGFPSPKNGLGYSDDEYEKLGGYELVPTRHQFRIRFTPQDIGEWKALVRLESSQVHATSEEFEFNVVESSGLDFLTTGVNGRYMESGGESYYPMACNLPWPQTSPAYDTEFYNRLKSKWWGGRVGPRNEQYRQVYVLPRVYDKYIERMGSLVDSGINLFRTIMYPSGTEIEYEELGDYTNRLHMAQEMDRILEYAEEKGVYLLWDLQIHYTYQYGGRAYGSSWTWDRKIKGQYQCYRNLLGVEKSPMEFFKNKECRKYYKQRLRYLISRYGYSPNIGIFELFSEITNVGASKADHSGFYKEDENWKIYRDWQVEMAGYINSMHNGKIHMLTGSFAGEKSPKDDVFESEEFQVMSSNIYNFNNPRFASFWIDNIAKWNLNEDKNNGNPYSTKIGGGKNIKPMIYSETDPVIVEAICGDLSVEFDRFYWQGLFSGIAGAISWSLIGEKGDYSIYKNIAKFIAGYNFDKDNWHPGASKLIKDENPYSWIYKKSYAKKMDGIINPKGLRNKKRVRHADLVYLRSGDLDEAIGVVSNKTYNAYTTDSSFQKIWDQKIDTAQTSAELNWRIKPIKVKRNVDPNEEKLVVTGLNRGKYVVNYYYPHEPEKLIYSSLVKGNKVKIDFPELLGDDEHYIVLFKIIQSKK